MHLNFYLNADRPASTAQSLHFGTINISSWIISGFGSGIGEWSVNSRMLSGILKHFVLDTSKNLASPPLPLKMMWSSDITNVPWVTKSTLMGPTVLQHPSLGGDSVFYPVYPLSHGTQESYPVMLTSCTRPASLWFWLHLLCLRAFYTIALQC